MIIKLGSQKDPCRSGNSVSAQMEPNGRGSIRTLRLTGIGGRNAYLEIKTFEKHC